MEVTDVEVLLFLVILERKFPTLEFRLVLEPITISSVLEEWDWSLFTFYHSVMFPKSEFELFANSTESYEKVNICKSSEYRQGGVDFKQFGR